MNDRWPIHTLVFDLDDTLYPERDFVIGGFRAVDAWVKKEHGVEGFGPRAEHLFTRGSRGKIFDSVALELGIEPTKELISRLVDIYRGHQPKLQLFKDAVTALEWGGTSFRFGLITDGPAPVQARKVSALGLEKVIPCRILSDELGREYWKPSEEPYRRVMIRWSGPKRGYVYVADNPHKDFIAPRQLGWRTIRVRRPGGEHFDYEGSASEVAEIEINSLDELRHCLRPWP